MELNRQLPTNTAAAALYDMARVEESLEGTVTALLGDSAPKPKPAIDYGQAVIAMAGKMRSQTLAQSAQTIEFTAKRGGPTPVKPEAF